MVTVTGHFGFFLMKFKVPSHTFQIYIVTFPLKNSGQKLVLMVGGYLKVTQPFQKAKNRQKFVFLDFCLILIFNPRTTFRENLRVKRLAEVL